MYHIDASTGDSFGTCRVDQTAANRSVTIQTILPTISKPNVSVSG
jgi:hypothetical protein